MWEIINIGAWVLSVAFLVWMLYDWYKVDSTYSEEILTSSREGELEAKTEKHKV